MFTIFPQKYNNVVNFKNDSPDRNCAKNWLFGRNLGKYLTMIHWNQGDHEKYQAIHHHRHRHLKSFNKTSRTYVITWYYQVPSPGSYFVEIMVIFCNDFLFDFDFNQILLGDPMHNNLTAQCSFIELISSSFITDKQGYVYWKWKSEPGTIILYTTYQCLNCRSHKSNDSRYI